ncbi:MAG: lipopolysaccharide biosynthesis protein, partial [Gammaproteobacteria bacterium]|nr:lipopolysaccharide biosynthesis protein [Gammaproteobacteria bacterium]
MDLDKTSTPLDLPQPLAAEEGLDLLALWQSVYRHKLAILLLTLLVVMVTTLVVYRQTPIYQAETSLMIERKAGKVVSIEQIYNPEGGNNEYLQTQFELIKSRSLAERVARELGLTEHPEFDPRQRPEPTFDWRGWLGALELSRWLPVTRPADLRPPEEPAEERIFAGVVSAFLGRVSVAPKRNTQLVTIAVEMADPVLAAKAANALAQGYIDSQFEARLGMSQAAAGWMSDRLAELKTALETSEQRLQDYREEQNLVDVAGMANLSGQELSQIGTRMVEADRELASIENQYQQIETMKGAGWERQRACQTR